MRLLSCIFIILIVSCKSIYLTHDYAGEYVNHGEDYVYRLVLHNDSSFFFSQNNLGIVIDCNGYWNIYDHNTIIIECSEEKDLGVILSTGYMMDRQKTVLVKGPNIIEIDGMKYKKTKSPSP